MNTLEKYQADVEAAQKLLERAISSFEEAKKQEEEATVIKLKLPKYNEKYASSASNGFISTRTRKDLYEDAYYLATFASTNKAQATAFTDALAVMAEMRMQEGIVNPTNFVKELNYTTIYLYDGLLEYGCWKSCVGASLFPCYKDNEVARIAVAKVGEQRVIDCIKTMNFMTPESRGEV